MPPFSFADLAPFLEETEEGRRILFGGLFPENQSFGQQQQQQQLFIPTFNRFLSQIGQDLQAERQPTTFSDFARQNIPRLSASLPSTSTPGLTSRTQFTF